MLTLLVRYKILTNRGGGIVTNNFINVYWDDVAVDFEVQKFDNEADTSGTVISIGPGLGAMDIDFQVISGLQDPSGGFTFLQYRYCDSTTLVTFYIKSTFPYAVKADSANHEACGVAIVCDLTISDVYTSQQASSVNANDGALSVSAESSNGTIKFSLDDPDFDYASQGQESGDFAGILPGMHTVTAKDASGCFDQIEIEVKYNITYGVMYRLEYQDINGNQTRVDILERDYEGATEEVCGTGKPFSLKYTGDGDLDKFKPVIPSVATLTLKSETNFKFRHIFTQDDRKYQMRYYKNYGVTTPAFTPAAVADLDDWTSVDLSSFDWTTGIASPFVEFIDAAAGDESDFLVTTYSFEAGKRYTFSYEFHSGDSTHVAGSALFYVCVLDSSNNIISQNIVSVSQSFPIQQIVTVTGECSFIATSAAAKIGIKCISQFPTAFGNFFVDSFVNETEAIAATDWELKWIGYVISDNYNEAYLAPPYAVQIVATDGLADLKNFDFLDQNERRYREDIKSLTAIKDILNKTDLGINIQCGINRYETSMDQGDTDDPLNQCKFNPGTFYDVDEVSSCLDVLEEILKPFGARLLQRNAKWFITSVEEHLDVIDYREFDADGTLISFGQITDQADIKTPSLTDKAAFRDRNQVLETVPAYGKMFFEHTLIKNDSLIASYGFEEEDVIVSPEGFLSFKNWNVSIADAPFVRYGIKKTKSLQGEYNFFVRGIEGPEKFLKLRTNSFEIEHNSEDAFEFSFDYSILLLSVIGVTQEPFWVRVKWLLKIGSYYYREDLGWVNDVSLDPYNTIYVSSFNKTQTLEVSDVFKGGHDTPVTEDCYVEVLLEGVAIYDFTVSTGGGTAYDELRAIDTIFLPVGEKVRGLYNAEAPNNLSQRYYTLESGVPSEDVPNVILPDDFDSVSNQKYWKLDKIETAWKVVEFIYLDNFVLLHFPKTAEPPENITIEKTNDKRIKLNFEGKYLLNDIDIDNINNSERTYKNYFKLLDGTPTQVWARTYRVGNGKLLDLLANDFASQYKRRTNKLTGTFLCDREILPTTLMTEVNDDSRKYLFMGYELDDKEYSIRFDLLQLGDVLDADGEFIDAGFTTGFSLGYRS